MLKNLTTKQVYVYIRGEKQLFTEWVHSSDIFKTTSRLQQILICPFHLLHLCQGTYASVYRLNKKGELMGKRYEKVPKGLINCSKHCASQPLFTHTIITLDFIAIYVPVFMFRYIFQ